jgi:hypothetical protein
MNKSQNTGKPFFSPDMMLPSRERSPPRRNVLQLLRMTLLDCCILVEVLVSGGNCKNSLFLHQLLHGRRRGGARERGGAFGAGEGPRRPHALDSILASRCCTATLNRCGSVANRAAAQVDSFRWRRSAGLGRVQLPGPAPLPPGAAELLRSTTAEFTPLSAQPRRLQRAVRTTGTANGSAPNRSVHCEPPTATTHVDDKAKACVPV